MKGSVKENLIVWLIQGVLENKENFRPRLVRWKINKWLKEADMQETKKWWQSRTLIVNALTGVASVLVALQTDGNLDPKTVGLIGSAIAVINIILRLVTDKPVGK